MKLVLKNFVTILNDERTYLVRLNEKLSFQNSFHSKCLKDIERVMIATAKLLKEIEDIKIQIESRNNLSFFKLKIEENRYLLKYVLRRVSNLLFEGDGYNSEESLADTVLVTSSSSNDNEGEL